MRACAVVPRLLILAVLGCGDGGPPLVPVHGRLTLDGQPLPFKTVRFVPEPGTPGTGAGATTRADGTFTLLAVRPGATSDVKGVPPGWYRVVVTEPLFPIEPPPATAADGMPAPAIGLPDLRVRKQPSIPAAYTNAEASPLRMEVPRAGGEILLRLVLKP